MPKRLLLFNPDLAYLGAPSLLAGIVERGCRDVASATSMTFELVPMRYSRGKKLRAMMTSLCTEGFAAAAPTLRHFAAPATVTITDEDVVVVGFQLTWAAVRSSITTMPTTRPILIVHNREPDFRRMRPPHRGPGHLVPWIEFWNLRGVRWLDNQSPDADLAFLSDADLAEARVAGVRARTMHYVGFATSQSQDEISRAAANLDGASFEPRSLLLVGNGDNQDNVRGLQWFFDDVAPGLDGRWRLIVAGPRWPRVAPTPQNLQVEYVGFIPSLASVVRPGNIGLNLDLAGLGLKTKAVEYLALGLPFISSAKAITGFPIECSSRLPATDDPQLFRAELNRLADDNVWRRKRQEVLTLGERFASREAFANRLAAVVLGANTSGASAGA